MRASSCRTLRVYESTHAAESFTHLQLSFLLIPQILLLFVCKYSSFLPRELTLVALKMLLHMVAPGTQETHEKKTPLGISAEASDYECVVNAFVKGACVTARFSASAMSFTRLEDREGESGANSAPSEFRLGFTSFTCL